MSVKKSKQSLAISLAEKNAENPVNDETIKNLTSEILDDQDLNFFEKKEQLEEIIIQNSLNVNQTKKINRMINGLSPVSGRSYGQRLVDAAQYDDN